MPRFASLAAFVAVSTLALAASAVAPDARPPQRSSDAARLGVYGAAGFPSLLTVGGGLTFSRTVTLGFEYGFLPLSTVAGADVSYRSYAGDLRIHPFSSGAFFFGARAGRQHVSASVTRSVEDTTASGSAVGDGWYLNPRMGVSWTTSWGLSVGADAGFRVPLSHRTQQSAPPGVSVPQSATDSVDLFVATVIPTLTLLQLGLVF